MSKPVAFGRFLLGERVAIGGMAEVFAAVIRDDPSGRPYAVKRLLPTLADDAEMVRMFLDEARVAVQLEHPGIVQVHDLGRLGSRYYMAMEYVAGRDLRTLLDRLRTRGERLAPALAVHVAVRMADALDHAHRKRGADGSELRVVHRDVSPGNVLVGFDGSVRIIDFGIAEASLRGRRRRKSAGLRGKLGYMSPEMVRGLPVDRRSDVFALGIVLHEMLAGVRLFTGPSELAVMEKVRAAQVRPPSALNPAVPRALDAVVLRALAREPEARFAWASELRDALAPFAETGAGGLRELSAAMARSLPGERREEEKRLARLRCGGATR